MEFLQAIALPAAILGGLGLFFGIVLIIAAKKLHVPVDERVEAVRALLPGANCGGCGKAGCDAFAKALVAGEVPVSGCAVTSQDNARQIAALLGMEFTPGKRKTAFVACRGGRHEAKGLFVYQGLADCASAARLNDGFKACKHGCLGLGTCVAACPFGAIHIGKNGVAEVDRTRCTGCGTCVQACPKGVIAMVPFDQPVRVACQAIEKGVEVRDKCRSGCIGCGLCARACKFDALKLEGNLPRIDYDKCRHCGQCASKCPTGAIRFMREAQGHAMIDERICDGCEACKQTCPNQAISGVPGQLHLVDEDICAGCGLCVPACPKKALSVGFADKAHPRAAKMKMD
nr:4Fe-4S binding protein [bacterium]